MRVTRFFHIRAILGAGIVAPKGGATIVVNGDVSDSDEAYVSVSHTLCSINDSFCKATGRKWAMANQPTLIPLKGLAGYLHKIAKKVARQQPCYLLDVTKRSESELWNRDYNFAKRYWLKKEKAPAPVALVKEAGAQEWKPANINELEVVGPRH